MTSGKSKARLERRLKDLEESRKVLGLVRMCRQDIIDSIRSKMRRNEKVLEDLEIKIKKAEKELKKLEASGG